MNMKRSTEILLLPALMLLSLGVGLGVSWWYNKPPTPWMEFYLLQSRYEPADPAVKVSGTYQVNKECDKDAVIWRIEAIATDGQVAEYGPQVPRPVLTEGRHWFETGIPLEAEIYPDGWAVRILVTCPGKNPETVASQPALVDIDRGVASHPQ